MLLRRVKDARRLLLNIGMDAFMVTKQDRDDLLVALNALNRIEKRVMENTPS